MIDRSNFRVAGNVTKMHGLKGELVVQWDVELPLDEEFLMIDMEGLLVPYKVLRIAKHGADASFVQLKGVTDENTATPLVGRDVYLPKGEDDEDMMSYEDLVGYHVWCNEQAVGTIVEVDDQTSNILFVVDTPQGELLLPACEEYVVGLDVDQQVVEMDFPEELLHINAK